MNIDLRPWRRLLAVWLPVVVLFLASAAFFVWQTSESGGRRTLVRNQIRDLEQEIARLQRLQTAAASDRQAVAEINGQFDLLYNQTFGDLDQRLTRILRAVGSATREAGLLPETFAYTATDNRSSGFIRFGIRYAVDGEYEQIRRMIAAIQSSSEFLVIENLTLVGDEDSLTRDLAISVTLATFLAEADEAQLRRLTGNITQPVESNDG
jgi:Tfp pilus assembly protein PilO